MTAPANDFVVMTSGAFTAAHLSLVPQLESLTKKKIVTATTSVGTGETSIHNRLKASEIADIVIVAEPLFRQFLAEGLVQREGYKSVAQSSMGIAVRAGAPKPDISTVEGLRRAFLEAKTIAYSASVSGEYFTKELCQYLGVADEVLPKSRFIGGGERTGAVVARGEADIAFQQMSELLPVPGIAHITPLPPEVQRVTTFFAGVGHTTRDAALARKVIDFLASPATAGAITRTGLELVK